MTRLLLTLAFLTLPALSQCRASIPCGTWSVLVMIESCDGTVLWAEASAPPPCPAALVVNVPASFGPCRVRIITYSIDMEDVIWGPVGIKPTSWTECSTCP